MSKSSKTEQLKKDLLIKIRTGLIMPGESIPSENQLCSQYGITRPTVRQVLSELCRINLLEKRPGIGTFVKDPNMPPEDFFSELHIGSDIFFELSEYYAVHVVRGIQSSKFVRNCYFTPVCVNTPKESHLENTDALLLSSFYPKIRTLASRFTKPIVILNQIEPMENVGMVYVDHYSEAKRGVDYLIKYGHRKIALIGDDSYQDPVTLARCHGWADAFTENGLEVPGQEYRIPFKDVGQHCDDSFMEHLKELDFTAMFFTKGITFIATHAYLKNYFGKNFCDIKILIFDDLSKLKIFNELSALFIKQPLEEQGALAIEYLRHKAYDSSYPVIDRKLNCTLIIQ